MINAEARSTLPNTEPVATRAPTPTWVKVAGVVVVVALVFFAVVHLTMGGLGNHHATGVVARPANQP